MCFSKIKGVLCASLAAITYGMNPLFGIPLYAEGITPNSVLFYRFALASVFMGVSVLLRRGSFTFKKKHLIPLLLAGVMMALTCLFWFMTFKIMDSGIAAAMLFIYPVMVALIMRIFFHEKLSFSTLSGMVLAVISVALLCGTGSGGNVPVSGVVCIMFSALAYAVYIVMVKTTSLKELAPDTLTFYAMIFSVIIFLIPLRMGVDLQMLDSWKEWGNAVGLALFPSLCAFLFAAIAVNHIGATQTAIFGALEPVTAVSIGMIVFGESISALGFFSIVLIIFAVVTVICGKSPKTENESTVQ